MAQQKDRPLDSEFFEKRTNNNVLTNEHILKIIDLFDKKEDVVHVCALVDNEKIAQNDFNLAVSSYVEAKDTREVININELNLQIKQTVAKISNLREQIDDIVAQIEADGAEYIKVFRHNTDVILVDGFDGEQIIDALVEEPFFQDCRHALSPDGVFVTNWWSGDKRYHRFIERLLNVFEGRVLELPAESHGNMAVMAFQSSPKEQNLDKLKKRAEKLSGQYGLDFKRMLNDLKANNPNNGKHFYL